MPTRLVHLVIDAADPARLARFWAAALDWEVAAEEPDEVVVWPPGFSYPGPSALPLVFVPVPDPKRERTGRIWTWPAPRPGTRRRSSAGCATWGPGRPISARARCRGWCWPTRKATGCRKQTPSSKSFFIPRIYRLLQGPPGAISARRPGARRPGRAIAWSAW